MTPTDLKTARLIRGLTISGLASGILRPATLQEAESGKRLPRKKTRLQLESVIGPVNWMKTLSQDREHVVRALQEFTQVDEPGAEERVYFLKQVLELIQEEL